MALEVHDTMRMDTALAGNLPVLEWKVNYEGMRDENYAAVLAERSLTGQLHVHRVLGGGGTVMQFRDYTYLLILTRAEYLLLRALVGKVCYFMPHYRDEDDALTYRKVVLFEMMGEERILDPILTYFQAAVRLIDAEGCTVG